MNHILLAQYLLYIVVSLAVTIWVARTLHKNGQVFLVDTFDGRDDLARSVNHLLVVGFYLINLGFIAVFLRQGFPTTDWVKMVENLATKQGIVLLVLGGMHLFNLLVFMKIRKRPKAKNEKETRIEPAQA